MKIDPETLYLQFGQLAASMPDLSYEGDWRSPESQLWIGRVGALVTALGELSDIVKFNVSSANLGSPIHEANAQAIRSIFYRSLARAELAAPAAMRGQFIAAGDTLSAFAAVSKVLATARRDLLIIDAYADQAVITDFAVTAPEGVHIRLLGADKEARKAVLMPAVQRWEKQFGASRPLSVRVAPAASLHDRLIMVDGTEAWSLGQSFNGMAQRSHTSILKADADLAKQKIAAYTAIWDGATPLT